MLQSFDWLAAFHLELLQAVFSLLYNCQLLCFWWLALSIVVEVFPLPFFQISLLQGCLLQTRYAQLYVLSMSGVYFLKNFKSNLSPFALWKTPSFVILSVHFIFNIPLQLHVSNAFTTFPSFFSYGPCFWSINSDTPNTSFVGFFFISKLRLFENTICFLLINITSSFFN